jgi:hypothetical protein
MRLNRLVAGTVTAGLLGLTPLAVAAPSQASENRTVTVTAAPSVEAVSYGDDLSVSVQVVDNSTGSSTSYGTSTLYAMEAGAAEFTPVATGTYPGSSFYDVKPKANTLYKVVYNGYVAESTYQNNYAAAESATFSIGVARKLTLKNPRGTLIKGKVSPKFSKKKVLVQKQVGKKWKKFRALKTSKKGTFTITLPASRKRTNWRFVVKADKNYLGAVDGGSTQSYRTVGLR